MSSFEPLLGATASRHLLELPADEQWAVFRAIEELARHPFTTGLAHWIDAEGRENFLRFIDGWEITFFIDHADRKLRIVDLSRY
jgi:hypothetical protein